MLWVYNLKKAKGQYLSFGIMICIAALFLNTALVLSLQMEPAYTQRFKELDTAGINILIPKMLDQKGLVQRFEDIDGVEKAETHHGVFVTAAVKDFQNSDFDMNTVFYNLDEPRVLNRLDISDVSGKNAVYIPEYISALGGFPVGEAITYSIDGKDYTWTVGQTVEEMQYGNYGTSLIGAYLPENLYKKLAKDHGEVIEYSLKTADNADLAKIKNSAAKILSDGHIAALSLIDAKSSQQSRTMVSSLLIAILTALSIMILIVSIFLSNFKIRNTIEAEMSEMGVLKALGYTSSMILSSAVIPYTLTAFLAALAGVGLSYLLLPSMAGVLAVQSGFSFEPKFDLPALILTVLIPTGAVFLFSCLAARKIRKTEPISAIRGLTASSANKNYFPLETTAAPVKLTLILKQIASMMGQNLLLLVVSFAVMILLSFAAVLVYNVNIKPDNLMNTLQEETPSIILQTDSKDGLKEALKIDSRVNLVLEYSSQKVSYADGSLTAFVCEDFSKVTNDICYEGHNPVTAQEAAVGSALAEQVKIGDKIELKNGSRTGIYTVTGYIQSVNNAGMVCELTNEGYERISDSKPGTLNVYLKEKGAESFIEEFEKRHGDQIISALNFEKLNESGTKLYAGIVSAVAILILIISILIVLLVMYVIISSLLIRRKQEFGIYKAMGWSSSQLIFMNAAGFLPAISTGCLLSAFLSLLYLPAVYSAIFELLGASKNHFVIPLWFVLLFAAGFIVICFAISLLLAMPIRKITPYSLLKE